MIIKKAVLVFVLGLLFFNFNVSYGSVSDTIKGRVLFRNDDFRLGEEGARTLDSLIRRCGRRKIEKVIVWAHTDTVASKFYNLQLSRKRAGTVEEYLVQNGINSGLISKSYFGETKPVSKQNFINRRAEIYFILSRGGAAGGGGASGRASVTEKRFVLMGTLKDSATRASIPGDMVVEIKGSGIPNKFLKTQANGNFRFLLPAEDSLLITFSKDGYLSRTYSMGEMKEIFRGKDSMHLEALLSPIEVVEKITLENIYFYQSQDKFLPSSDPSLKKLLALMQTKTDLYIEIQGHMNHPLDYATSPYQQVFNMDLSFRRARAVFNYLSSNGIDSKRMTYKGLSNYRMLYPYPRTKEEAGRNMRVEIWLLKVK